MIPFSERHLKMTVQEWVVHYNRGRPHSALAQDSRSPPSSTFRTAATDTNCLTVIASTSVLGGLHHEYSLVKEAA
jgi:hypothetical protein